MSALDTQIGGDHYKSMKIQPMEYSMQNGLDACQHTAIKYITRFRQKGGIQDLEKAKHCIDMLIQFELGHTPTPAADSGGFILCPDCGKDHTPLAHCPLRMGADFGQQNMIEWPATDERIDHIGQNGPTGEHYLAEDGA